MHIETLLFTTQWNILANTSTNRSSYANVYANKHSSMCTCVSALRSITVSKSISNTAFNFNLGSALFIFIANVELGGVKITGRTACRQLDRYGFNLDACDSLAPDRVNFNSERWIFKLFTSDVNSLHWYTWWKFIFLETYIQSAKYKINFRTPGVWWIYFYKRIL